MTGWVGEQQPASLATFGNISSMTAAEYLAAYALCKGVTVDELRAQGYRVHPCHCGEDFCEGWRMVRVAPAGEAHEHADRGSRRLPARKPHPRGSQSTNR